MVEAASYLFAGILFGSVAGISPGPLLTLVISETLKHDRKQGIIIASAPLVTDIPIVFVSVLILAKLSDFRLALGIISVCGAFFLASLAYESLAAKRVSLNFGQARPHALRRGILTNFLSPHPYLFWITVGAPTVINGYRVNLLCSLLFIAGFYVFLVGSKITIAVLADRCRSLLSSTGYVLLTRLLGVLLAFFSLKFLKDGLDLLGLTIMR